MSGGIGPCGDIHLPTKEEEEGENEQLDSSIKEAQDPNLHHHRFLTFQLLNALTVIVVFSASGMVAMEDFAFVLFSFFYIFFMPRVAFPAKYSSPQPHHHHPFGEKNRLLTLYIVVGALISLFLPIAYIFEGIYEGDKEGIAAAPPHVSLTLPKTGWKGALAAGPVLSSETEPSDCHEKFGSRSAAAGLSPTEECMRSASGNTESRPGGVCSAGPIATTAGSSTPKFKAKAEKDSRLKYVPKQRTSSLR